MRLLTSGGIELISDTLSVFTKDSFSRRVKDISGIHRSFRQEQALFVDGKKYVSVK